MEEFEPDVDPVAEIDIIGNESAYYEKFFLDDFDNYLDEINDRITVSRLVTESVIKGIVNAVLEESAVKLASKEAEIAILKEELRLSNWVATIADATKQSALAFEHLKMSFDGIMAKPLSSDDLVERIYPEHIGGLRSNVENQVQMLKEGIESIINVTFHGLINRADKQMRRFIPKARNGENPRLLDEEIGSLRVILVDMLDEFSAVLNFMKDSAMERHWEHEMCDEICAIAVQNFVLDIQLECEAKILEQGKLIGALSANYRRKIGELSSFRDDLDVISKSLSNTDYSLLLSHSSSESLEELNSTRRKDQFHLKALGSNSHSLLASNSAENGVAISQETTKFGKSVPDDFPHLKHMSKEDLAAYYKTEMTTMRRQHDKAMEEKTDELFKLKREFLKEKGSLLSKKDKELEHLKKSVRRIMSKLDVILTEKEILTVIDYDCAVFRRLKNQITSMFVENERLQGLLIGKKKAVELLSLNIRDAESKMMADKSANENLRERISKMVSKLECMDAEFAVKEELDALILKDIISKHKVMLEDSEIEADFICDIYSIFVKELTSNAMSATSYMELLESALLKNESCLQSEIHAGEKLRQELTSISASIKKKDRFEIEFDLMKQELDYLRDQVSKHDLVNQEIGVLQDQASKYNLVKQELDVLKDQVGNYDLIKQELISLRDQVSKQRLIISGNKIHSDFLKSQFEGALQQLQAYELEINDLNQKLTIISGFSEDESEKWPTFFVNFVKGEKKLSNSIIDGSNLSAKQVEEMIISLKMLSESALNFESKLVGKIKRNESRIRVLSNQCSLLKCQINALLQKGFWYKRMFEIRNSNLVMAEAEVDLLGDEVDGLLSVLGKVYVALDHYSPVLQHYPGVMEILKLVRRELEGEEIMLK